MVNDIYKYRDILAELGITVPSITEMRIQVYKNNVSKKVNLTEIAPFYGESFDILISKAKSLEDCLLLVRRIFACLGGFFEKSIGLFTQAGIDLKPRNFAGNGNEVSDTYIDLFVPKLKKGDLYMNEFPPIKNPTVYSLSVERHYYKVGICIDFLIQLARIRPEFYSEFEGEVKNFLISKGEREVLSNFQERLVAREIHADKEDLKIISNLGFIDIFNLREIACLYASRGLLKMEDLKKIFEMSHFLHQPIHLKTMNKIKKTLINVFS